MTALEELSAELMRALDRMPSRHGRARHTLWRTCADGWVVGYTTERIVGGEHDGKYATLVYKPIGRGARGGRKTATQWELVKQQPAATRKLARARGVKLWKQHEGKG